MKDAGAPLTAGDNRTEPVAIARPPAQPREWVSGFLIGAALCWPFLLPSLIPVRWWMLLPLAVVAGILRRQSGRKLSRAAYPLLGLGLVIAIFVLVAAATTPLNAYGREKLVQFTFLAGLAFLAAFRQMPLTVDFSRGLRINLIITLALCIIVIIVKRNLYLQFEEIGAAELREEVSTTGLPLAMALASCGLITSRLTALRLFLTGIVLLGIAVLEVLVRGRFDALVLVGVAALLMLGPPWRHLFQRLALFSLLGLAILFTYTNVVSQLGQSYAYLEQLRRGEFAGRAPLFQEAWQGFLAHPFGQGFGAFERQEPAYRYPHNLPLEVAYELGILGLLCLVALYLLVIQRVWQLWFSPPHRMLGLLLLIPFLQPLKAGDLATFAFQWVLVYMLIVATPLSEHWPLAGRRSRA